MHRAGESLSSIPIGKHGSTPLQTHPACGGDDRRTGAVAPRRDPVLTAALTLVALGFAAFLAAWYLAVDVLALPRFAILPGPTEVALRVDEP